MSWGFAALAELAAAEPLAFTLSLEQGSYSLTGQNVGTNAGRRAVAEQGAYAVAGQALGLLASRFVSLQQGALVLSGQAVAFRFGHSVALDVGAYALTGQAIGMSVGIAFIPPDVTDGPRIAIVLAAPRVAVVTH